MLKGGKSGPALAPGKPGESLMLKKIAAGEMPPRRRLVEASIKVIEAPEVAVLAKWIELGAPETDGGTSVAAADKAPPVTDEDRQFWSFRPPQHPSVPLVRAADRVRNPVDAFVVDKLEAAGLSLAPEADRVTLIRRAYFDLIGLPPDPSAVAEFVGDADPLAYEKLIDRLLDSPHYGERWGRYWLDVAGYADSEGVQHADPIRPHAWRYRDYVIRSLNSDKPYDRFLLEQIAGDELADYENGPVTDEVYDNLVATGFLRMAPDGTTANITNFVPDRLEIIGDEINILASAVMGLTIRCARCHDHKMEPIPQQDYYRLAAILKGAFDEHDWLRPATGEGRGPFGNRLLPHVTAAERAAWEQLEKQIGDEIAPLKSALAAKEGELTKKHVEERLAKLPQPLHDDLRQMLATPADKRNEIQKYLAAKFEAVLRVDASELRKVDPEFKKFAEETEQKIKAIDGKRQPEPLIHALWDRGEPSPTYVLRRGNYLTPGRFVQPGVPTVLAGSSELVAEPPWPGAKKTGRRLALARWLTRPDHPLTARVMINRIWKHHFDRAIVTTLDNFGKSGQRPSHPELLDWLAVEFVRRGWSIKAMHRLIMTSSTYRQSSRVAAEHERLDPDNRLLSRMPLRRLDAESLRDALLAVSGRLDTTAFGPADAVEARPDGTFAAVARATGWRRTVYVRQRRTEIPTLLEDFDLPPMNPNCIERPVSTVAPQALHLMNNAMIHDLAAAMADRVATAAGPCSDSSRRIELAYRTAIGRPPVPQEHTLAAATLTRFAEEWTAHLTAQAGPESANEKTIAQQSTNRALGNLCHALMNSAEFVNID